MPTKDELLLDNVIRSAKSGLLRDRFSLTISNAALQFCVANAPQIKELSNRTLIRIAELVRDHPATWQEMMRRDFRSHPRQMFIPDCPTIVPDLRLKLCHTIVFGTFQEECWRIPDLSIDAVITSPPYCQQRRGEYEGVDEAKYSDWTVDWMRYVKRFIKPNVCVAINLKTHTRGGNRSVYIEHTVLALIADGWQFIHEITWLKPDAGPSGRHDRPRESTEKILLFSLSSEAYLNPKAAGKWSDRLGFVVGRFAAKRSLRRRPKGSPVYAGWARCPDYIIANVGRKRRKGSRHTAVMPVDVPLFLIKLLSPIGGNIVDPFAGTGTTNLAAKMLGRSSLGFEQVGVYVTEARERLKEVKFAT